MSTLSAEPPLIRALDVRIRRLNGRLMVLATDQAFELDGFAEATFWAAERHRDADAVVAAVAAACDTDAAVCRPAVHEALRTLRDADVLTPVPA